MKISKLFHWLYFIVMMLPIFSIPIFAIYSHRHTIDSYSVQADETIVVDFNQLFDTFSVEHHNTNIDINVSDYVVSGDFNSNATSTWFYVSSDVPVDCVDNDVYAFRLDVDTSLNSYSLDLYLGNNTTTVVYLHYSNITSSGTYITSCTGNNDRQRYLAFYLSNINALDSDDYIVFNVQLFNLTKMFGSGNEPTVSDFDSWYPNEYYEYTLSRKELLKTGNYITYADTDIGSQFTYDVYNVVDKYFNYDNVFNFSQLYDYLNMTFFNGGASLGFFIFWHLLIYWLLTSILWLVFDVLMYVPQLVHRWLDKASLS